VPVLDSESSGARKFPHLLKTRVTGSMSGRACEKVRLVHKLLADSSSY
jgi:hypothetical protein